jgi:hypothetical protein
MSWFIDDTNLIGGSEQSMCLVPSSDAAAVGVVEEEVDEKAK